MNIRPLSKQAETVNTIYRPTDKNVTSANDGASVNSSLYSRTHGVIEENMFIRTSMRTRSPSPTPSSRSIPRIHRFGKKTNSVSTIPPLRRPRIAFNPQAVQWQ